MTLETSLHEMTQGLIDLLTTNKVALGLQGIYYGDQTKIPVTPAVCVEGDNTHRGSQGPMRKVDIEFRIYLFVYHSDIQSPQSNAKAANQLAETITTLIHANPRLARLDGSQRVIGSLIEDVGAGYIKKENSIIRSSRLVYTAKSQELLPG